MRPCPPRLALMMQFINVVSNRDQDTLCQDIRITAVHVLPEVHILLHGRKRAFHLCAPVHPELDPPVGEYALKIFFPFLFFDLRYIQDFVSFLHRCFAVVVFYAFFFERASFAVIAPVDRHSTHVSARTLFGLCSGDRQFFPDFTGVHVPVGIVVHVFVAANVRSLSPGF